jgi:formylglycine-generating enzyme required for sulfatase activity
MTKTTLKRKTRQGATVDRLSVACTWLLVCLLCSQTQADVPVLKNTKDGAEWLRIPAGTFLMGSTKEEVDAQFLDTGLPEDWKKYTDDERPRHGTNVPAFHIYKYEVTNTQYKAFIDATGHRAPEHWSAAATRDEARDGRVPEGRGDHPVVQVSWDDAQAYCRWAGVSLPTEIQWEYAARGPAGAPGQPSPAFPWGNSWDRNWSNNSSLHAGKELQNGADWNAWYGGDQNKHYPLTSAVGSFPKGVSPFGVHDMAGNAWEWCANFETAYPLAKDAEAAGKRARRGGSWANVALHIRSADRQGAAAGDLNLYTGFRCVKAVEPHVDQGTGQAGDRFVRFVLDEIENTRKRIPEITRAAEAAADRIVHQDGEFLSAGDQSFALEPVWRAGGIAFARQYQPEEGAAGFPTLPSPGEGDEVPYYRTAEFVEHFTVKTTGKNDVVLLGYENEKKEQRHLAAAVERLLKNETLVIFFGSTASADRLKERFGPADQLLYVTHDVPDGGVIDIEGWPGKICSGRSIANRLYLWTFQAELISAFLRRGKMPGILLSVTYESPQIWNTPLLHDYKFIPAFNVTPVPQAEFGNTYLDHIRRIVSSIVPDQRAQFRTAARWLADAVRASKKIFALLIHGLDPEGLPGDPGLFKVYSEGNAYYPQLDGEIEKDDVALFVGYNWYPPRLANTVDKAGAKQILCFALVDDLPPKSVVYGEVGEIFHPTSFDQLPQAENRIYIDLRMAQYNAVLEIPNYPIPALETSSFAEDVIYWHLVADTVELLARERREQ